MDLSIKGNYLQPIGGRPAQGAAASRGSSSFPYQLSENHRVIVGPGCTIPMWSEDTVYYGLDGSNQDVHVTLTEDSTEDDPIVRIKGHSVSGEFDFTRHIKDIDPSNASYAEMCALIGWEERINPSGKKGLLMPTPLGMDVGNVTQKQNFVNLSSRYLASGKFSPSIADQTKELLELYLFLTKKMYTVASLDLKYLLLTVSGTLLTEREKDPVIALSAFARNIDLHICPNSREVYIMAILSYPKGKTTV